MLIREFQPAFTSGEFSPALQSRVDLGKYDSAARLLRNVTVHPSGGASKTPGTRFVAETRGNGKARLIPFIFSNEEAYVLEFTAGAMRVLTENGPLQAADGSVYELGELPYAEEDLPGLSFAQNAGVLYLAHRRHAPRKITRRAPNDWSSESLSFNPKSAPPPSVSASAVGSGWSRHKIYRYVVTAVQGESGEESLPSPAASVSGPSSMRLGALLSDGEALPDWFITLSWSLVPGADEYRVYKERGGGLFGYIGSAVSNYFEDRDIRAETAVTPPQASNVFQNGDYPACVGIYQQRLLFANSQSRPNTIWASRSGEFENFTKSLIIRAGDYIEAELASSRADPIVWVLGLRKLFAGAGGAEYVLGGAGGGAISPSNISAERQSAVGSAAEIPPLAVDGSILHVTRGRNAVSELQYDFSNDSYGGAELSLFAAHLFQGRKIKEMDYQQSPDSVLWCVMDDGLLLGLTIVRRQEVFAWHRHDTDGAWENVCVLPGSPRDRVFFVARRNIEGEERRYIEALEAPLAAPENFDRLPDEAQRGILARAFYVHSGLLYEGAPESSFGGLEHLEGKEVAVLADGAVLPRRRVANGRIDLPYASSLVVAGLPYTAEIETISYEPQGGVSVGGKRRIARVLARCQHSSGFEVGVNGEHVEGKWRRDEGYGMPPRLRSGTQVYSVPGVWGRESCVSFRSEDPVPLTVLSVIPLLAVPE